MHKHIAYRQIQIHYIVANSDTIHTGWFKYITFRLVQIHDLQARSNTLKTILAQIHYIQAGSNTLHTDYLKYITYRLVPIHYRLVKILPNTVPTLHAKLYKNINIHYIHTGSTMQTCVNTVHTYMHKVVDTLPTSVLAVWPA